MAGIGLDKPPGNSEVEDLPDQRKRAMGMSRSLLKSVHSGGMVRLSYDRVESQRRTL